jgi:hypothetical protein
MQKAHCTLTPAGRSWTVGTPAVPATNAKNSAAVTAAVRTILFMAISRKVVKHAAFLCAARAKRCDGHHFGDHVL